MSAPTDDASRPFDRAAERYDRSFTDRTLARLQRDAVWRALDAVVQPGMRLLELGCGTGEDATRLAARGLHVTATDVSEAMLAVTRSKAEAAGLAEQITVRRLDMGTIERELPTIAGRYDAALSNFGPLNCIPDRRCVGHALARVLPPGAPLLVVVLGSLCPWEVAWYLAHLDPATAFRRFRDGRPASVDGGAGLRVWYPGPGRLRSELAPWFSLESVEGLGVLLPPPSLEHLARRWPQVTAAVARLERRIARRWPWSRLGDHTMLLFERTDAQTGPI